MAKYRKKPVVVDAWQWTGEDKQEAPDWVVDYIESTCQPFVVDKFGDVVMLIETMEGIMTADQGDYIIKGIQGEIYPCKPDIFEQTYEKVIDAQRLVNQPDYKTVLNDALEQKSKHS